jgi:hypothetical protein
VATTVAPICASDTLLATIRRSSPAVVRIVSLACLGGYAEAETKDVNDVSQIALFRYVGGTWYLVSFGDPSSEGKSGVPGNVISQLDPRVAVGLPQGTAPTISQ